MENLSFKETYKTAVVSTGNIGLSDTDALDEIAKEDCSLVAKRPTGYFIKLYDEPELNRYVQLSSELNVILVEAAKLGFRCVELDQDAGLLDGVKKFDW